MPHTLPNPETPGTLRADAEAFGTITPDPIPGLAREAAADAATLAAAHNLSPWQAATLAAALIASEHCLDAADLRTLTFYAWLDFHPDADKI